MKVVVAQIAVGMLVCAAAVAADPVKAAVPGTTARQASGSIAAPAATTARAPAVIPAEASAAGATRTPAVTTSEAGKGDAGPTATGQATDAAKPAATPEQKREEMAEQIRALNATRRALEEDFAARERTVNAIEREFGVFDPRLIEALMGEGKALHALSRYGQAADTFERAQHISRVNDGLYNLNQLSIIDADAESLAAASRWKDATIAKELGLALAQRAYGSDKLEFVPALYNIGAWYERSGNVFGARQVYEHANWILSQRVGNDDVRRAEALRRLAYAYRLERFPEHQFANEEARYTASVDPDQYGTARTSTPIMVNRFAPGERALKDAIRIYQKQDPTDARPVAATLAELGDWYLLFDHWERALVAYQEALKQAGADAPTLFGDVHSIYWRPPVTQERPQVDSLTEHHGFVELTFDVTDHGDVTNARVAHAAPEGYLEAASVKALLNARYRPRLDANGRPMSTSGLHYRYEFVYYGDPRT